MKERKKECGQVENYENLEIWKWKWKGEGFGFCAAFRETW